MKNGHIFHLKLEIQGQSDTYSEASADRGKIKGGDSFFDVDDIHIQVTEREVNVNDGLAPSKRREMECWW